MRRKLTIRTKLAATLAVPLAALASFAALQVRDAYNRSDQVKLQAGLATSATGPAGVLNALENERDFEALRAIGAQNLVAPKNAKFSAQVTARTDVALANFRMLLARRRRRRGGQLPLDAVAGEHRPGAAAPAGRGQRLADRDRRRTPSRRPTIFDRYTER